MNREEVPRVSESAAETARDARALARGGGLGLLGVICGTLFQFLAFLIVTRGLSTVAAGVFFVSVALFMIVTNCSVLGADVALVRQVAACRVVGRERDIRATLIAGLVPVAVCSVVAAACVFAAAHLIAKAFFDASQRGDAVECIEVLSVFIPAASVTTVALAGGRGFGSMMEYVAIQSFGVPILRLAGVGAAIALGTGLVGTALGWGIPLAVGCAAAIGALARVNRALYAADSEAGLTLWAVAAEVWKFAAPRALAGVFGVLITWLDVLLVGLLASTRDAAIYAAVSRLLLLGAYTLQAISLAVASQFSELIAAGQLGRVERLYRVSTWWMMAVSWPLYTLYLAFAPVLMSIFGPAYVDGQWALVILALAGLFNLCTGNVTLLLLMTGHSVLNLANSAVMLAVNVGLDLLLIPAYGINGAALGWALSIVAINIASLVELRRLIRLRPFGDGFWVIASASLVSFGAVGGLVRLAAGTRLLALVCAVAIGTPIYLWVLWSSRARLGLTEIHSEWTRKPASAPNQ
jgi:O-antigen/teichoic acid export membrane protein